MFKKKKIEKRENAGYVSMGFLLRIYLPCFVFTSYVIAPRKLFLRCAGLGLMLVSARFHV